MNASIFASSMVSVLDELEVLQEFASQVVRAFGVRLTSKPFGLVLESLFSRLPGSPVLHRFLLTATATGTGDREGRLRSVALLCAFKARAGQAREGWAVLEPFSKSKRTAGELATLLPSAVLLTLAETAKIWDRPWARELVEAVLRSSRVSPSEKRKFESLLP
jgi:hypothetical protein